MTELKATNILDLFAIPDLSNKNFFIPDYQRGYRWGKTQIRQLLEDLYVYFAGKDMGSFYCLQPVVVKEMTAEQVSLFNLKSDANGNQWYEVIDGQQRLTTIRIILALEKLVSQFNDHYSFNIYYQTRPQLNLDNLFSSMRIVRDENRRMNLETAVDEKSDIDTWHIIQTAKQIIEWFQTESNSISPSMPEFTGSFYENFINPKSSETKKTEKSVQVIWYELKDGEPSELFKRLNDKMIALNNAELIRGMFLSESAKYPTDPIILNQLYEDDIRKVFEDGERRRKQSHIIEMWDVIESQLRDKRFWAFISKDNDAKKYDCRIEYLFDLISQKGPNERDPLFTYLEFERLLSSKTVSSLWALWAKVETYFSLLKAWYRDSYFYHKIGYLIAVCDQKKLTDLLDKCTEYSTSQFKEYVKSNIVETITDKKNKKKILDYSYDDNYELLKKVLFLFNVETTRQQEGEFFPFDRFKNEQNWTLEHIHAQNSDIMDRSDKKKWLIWFNENISTLKKLQESLKEDKDLAVLIADLSGQREKVDTNGYTFDTFQNDFNKVTNYFNKFIRDNGGGGVIHGIANLALLDGATNSRVSNSVFEVKRQKIMNADAQNEYIPVCTRRVFLKYYNSGDPDFTVQTMYCWSKHDMENYEANIKSVLSEYIEQTYNKAENKEDENE